ncbi:MAG TPA: sigma-70 family RNA polymerase sigma factor [Phycisphaerales bacterium]|nr:sigma-70 family RNA polymerase sigma factor [Phycisphaerales bacterium]HMP36031.1 sigma-70 family RNA polymerase sigma factor [Phycisphaerales bacterium]
MSTTPPTPERGPTPSPGSVPTSPTGEGRTLPLTPEERAEAGAADLDLMSRVATGDQRAVEELYDRFGALVFKSARQILPSRAEADDAVQEVFIRLWRTADRFDPRRAKLVTWVMLIARRHLIDRLRRNIASPTPAQLDDEWREAGTDPRQRPEGAHVVRERNARIRARIASLPELQRNVIERAYLQGFTLREVAEQIEVPLGTVKSALSRGLAKLRDELREELTGRPEPRPEAPAGDSGGFGTPEDGEP